MVAKPVFKETYNKYVKHHMKDDFAYKTTFKFIKTIECFRPKPGGREYYEIMDIYLDFRPDTPGKGQFLFIYGEERYLITRAVTEVLDSSYWRGKRWASLGHMILNELEIVIPKEKQDEGD